MTLLSHANRAGSCQRGRGAHVRLGALLTALVAAGVLATACSDKTSEGSADAGASADSGKAPGKCGFDPAKEQLDRTAKLTVSAGTTAIKEGDVLQKDTGGLKTGGAPLELPFDIKNGAAKDVALELLVDKIVFKYQAPDGTDDGAFRCYVKDDTGKEVPCATAQFKSVIPPGFDPACASRATTESLRFNVRFTKMDNAPREATVTVFANSATTSQSLKFTVATKAGKPAISVQPTEVNFGVVSFGQKKAEPMSVLNTGDANLQIKGVKWNAGDPRFELDVGGKVVAGGKDAAFDPPLEVTPGSSLPFTAYFSPDDDKGHTAEIEFLHNATIGSAKSTLKGNFEVPCLLVTPQKKLDMGVVYVGSNVTKSVVLQNCGAVDIEVSKTALGEDAQGVYTLKSKAPTETEPLKIAKNGKATVDITCTPPSENKDAQGKINPFTAKLSLADNTQTPNKTIDIQCYGTAASCPTAVIVFPDGEQIEPQMPIHLDALSSFAKPGQTIKSYKWKVTKQPAGATNFAFFPNDTSPTPVYGVKGKDPKTGKELVWATVSGEYCFELDVTDSSGTKACAVASSCMLVVPSVALHVELLWDTPADSNKTDTGDNAGTDLDLHFVHPKAYDGKLCTGTGSGPCQPDLDKDGKTDPWFNGVYDCFWYATTPSWGNPTDGSDNPSLDLDDTDGWGPENLNLVSPENNTLYGIGVHYWAANNFFPDDSTATVNVYVSGSLKGSFVQLLHQCDMWWVTQVQWSSGDLVAFGGANLAPPSTGKVTPSYWSNLAGTLNGPCKKK